MISAGALVVLAKSCSMLWKRTRIGWCVAVDLSDHGKLIAVVQEFDRHGGVRSGGGLVLCVTSLGTGWVRREFVEVV